MIFKNKRSEIEIINKILNTAKGEAKKPIFYITPTYAIIIF